MNIKLTLYLALIILLLAPIGAYCATETLQQKDEENSATGGASKGLEKDSSGMESLSDLTKNQAPHSRVLADNSRTTENSGCPGKGLGQGARNNCFFYKGMSRRSRFGSRMLSRNWKTLRRKWTNHGDKDFAKSVQRFTAMEAEQAAQILIQMDLESVKAILFEDGNFKGCRNTRCDARECHQGNGFP